MFMKRGGAPSSPPAPQPIPSATPTVRPDQIPYVDQPPPSGADLPIPSEEDVLANPTIAENALHAALTVRALKWLALLKQDETLNPQPGQRMVTLDTQVSMFKVISDWLKTSKKTKETGDEERSAPGIEQMREVIRQEMAARPPPKPKPSPFMETLEDDEAFMDGDPPRRRKGFQQGNKAAAAKPSVEDDGQLAIMMNRARRAASEED